jgi:GH24 family phage-related lysozyme (muramidase)
MNIDAAGLKFIADNEGFSEVVYNDSAGHPTIGYGHKIIPQDVHYYGVLETVSTELALEILHHDVAIAENYVGNLVDVALNQNQFNALVDFCYNCGSGNFQKSTLLKLLNNNHYDQAAEEFLKWDIAGGQVVQGLLNRRQREKDLFLSPVSA